MPGGRDNRFLRQENLNLSQASWNVSSPIQTYWVQQFVPGIGLTSMMVKLKYYELPSYNAFLASKSSTELKEFV